MALHEQQPGNGMVSYYAGRCLLELNQDMDEAIELLYGATLKQVPGDAVFYLGMAYHLDYNFKEAIKYYHQFRSEATRQEVKVHMVDQRIRDCRNAMKIAASYNRYRVMNVTFIDLTDSTEFMQVRMQGGELVRKPDAFINADEDREGIQSLMFMPVSPKWGDYVYFSGNNRAGRNGAQLFRVKKGAGTLWGDPRELKELNTEGDEILPYFDPISSDLYFASNGGEGMGGFDLFRSHYDAERDQWSEPINLGFPINSVADEYLLLPGKDLGMMMFFSNRVSTGNDLTVYRVHLVEPKRQANVEDPAMLKQIASLGGAAEEILAELESISRRSAPGEEKRVTGSSRDEDREVKQPEITRVKILPAEAERSEGGTAYQEILAGALVHQAASDSLKDMANEARAMIRESDDPNERWVWQKQIMVWEKKSRDEELLADELYALLDREREKPEAGPPVNVPETIEVDTVIGEMTVYRFTGHGKAAMQDGSAEQTRETLKGIAVSGEPGTPPAVTPGGAGREGKINRFDILSGSPYSAGNPIPTDVALPGGVFYRIQLGAFGQPADPGAFRGISPVTAESIPDRGLIKYYAGKFSLYDDAATALTRIRSEGYEDAFIVAWYNGKQVSTQRAKQLE